MNSKTKTTRRPYFIIKHEIPAEFRPAIKASFHSDLRQHKMGAAIYYKGQFLAAGFNSLKTDPITHYFDKAFCRHAEIHALKKAKVKKFDLTNASIWVYRMTKDGDLAMAKPCEMCMEKAAELGIREIFYTTNENSYKRIRL